MEVTVEHLGAVQFEIRARQHTLERSDRSERRLRRGPDAAGIHAGVIGSCADYYAAEYLRKQGSATEGTRVRMTAGKAAGPARLDNCPIEVSLPVLVGGDHRTGVEEAVKRCLIQNTLPYPPKITIDIEDGALTKAA